MINNDVLLFTATNEETPYEQLLSSKNKLLNHEWGFVNFFKAINWVCWAVLGPFNRPLYPLYYNLSTSEIPCLLYKWRLKKVPFCGRSLPFEALIGMPLPPLPTLRKNMSQSEKKSLSRRFLCCEVIWCHTFDTRFQPFSFDYHDVNSHNLFFLIMYWHCKEKMGVDHSWELKG